MLLIDPTAHRALTTTLWGTRLTWTCPGRLLKGQGSGMWPSDRSHTGADFRRASSSTLPPNPRAPHHTPYHTPSTHPPPGPHTLSPAAAQGGCRELSVVLTLRCGSGGHGFRRCLQQLLLLRIKLSAWKSTSRMRVGTELQAQGGPLAHPSLLSGPCGGAPGLAPRQLQLLSVASPFQGWENLGC